MACLVESEMNEQIPSRGMEEKRRSANFRPGVWGDHFLQYASNSYSLDSREVDLIAQVRAMLTNDGGNSLALLELIDRLQRLGIAYHFRDEIDSHLTKLSEIYPNLIEGRLGEDDLYMVSLLFRLLRQHGYHVSSDVFNKFKDAATGKFRESLAGNVLGILNLYEASYVLIPGEDTLEEALAFTSTHLESVNEERESAFVARLVRHVLKQPIWMGYPRVEAWHYIRIYQDDVSCDASVLMLAKLDFNSLQKLHQKEVCDVVRWWKHRNFIGNLPFARDRIVECHLWILALYFEPEFSSARIFLAKLMAIITLMDDMFDAYGTLKELELFTEAIERWDTSAVDGLPEYMKFYYRELMDVYNDLEEEMILRGQSYRLDYAKRMMKDQAKAYLKEVRWFNQKHIPPIEEYVVLASETIAHEITVVLSLVGMGNEVTEDSFKWFVGKPHMFRASATYCRLSDDLAGHKFEQERGHVASSIDCVVKQYGCTEQEAEKMIRKWIFDLWKEANEGFLRPLPVPMMALERNLNMMRSLSVIYDGGIDNFTQCTPMIKDVVTGIFVDPLPI